MADESIDEGEFWLPPRFLDDDLPACDRYLDGIGGDSGPWKKVLCPEPVRMPWWAESTIRAGDAPVRMSEQKGVQLPFGSGPHWCTDMFYPHQFRSLFLQSLIRQRMTQQQIWAQVVVADSYGHQPVAPSGTKNEVFMGGPVMPQCTGTGVFLPRQAGSRSRGPVLVPAKVVQSSLNLRFEKTGPRPKQQPLSRSRSNDYIYRRCSTPTCTSTKNGNADRGSRMRGKCCAEPRPAVNHEAINLPLDWTY